MVGIGGCPPDDPPPNVRVGWGCHVKVVGPQGLVETWIQPGENASYEGVAPFDDVGNPESPWYPGFQGQVTFMAVESHLGKYVETGEQHYFSGAVAASGPGLHTLNVQEIS
jgi:hypothetical protein